MPDFSALGWAGLLLVVVGLLMVIFDWVASKHRKSLTEGEGGFLGPIGDIIAFLISIVKRGIKDPTKTGWALVALGAILLIADRLIGAGPGPGPDNSPSPGPSSPISSPSSS
jgi:hypothetical protein